MAPPMLQFNTSGITSERLSSEQHWNVHLICFLRFYIPWYQESTKDFSISWGDCNEAGLTLVLTMNVGNRSHLLSELLAATVRVLYIEKLGLCTSNPWNTLVFLKCTVAVLPATLHHLHVGAFESITAAFCARCRTHIIRGHRSAHHVEKHDECYESNTRRWI